MESEEQKPKDIFLNSVEKSEDFETNPILDDEYFRRNIPKLEEIDKFLEKEIKMEDSMNLEKINKSSISVSSKQQNLENSAGIWEFQMENKIKMEQSEIDKDSNHNMKPDFSTYSKRKSENLQKIDNSVEKKIKLEEESLKMPRLEPVFHSFPSPKTSMETTDILMKPFDRDYRSKCALCSSPPSVSQMKLVRLKSEKLVIVVIRVLRGKCDADQAKHFLIVSSTSICKTHYTETIDSIFEVLNIKEPHEIATCPVQRVNELMLTVNSICESTTSLKFHESLNGFVTRNHWLVVQPSFRLQCSICNEWNERQMMESVTFKRDKLILMLARVITQLSTIDEAKQFMTRRMADPICLIHFSETIQDICQHLKTDDREQLLNCSVGMRKPLMPIVHSFCPNVTSFEFRRSLLLFVSNTVPSATNLSTAPQ